MAHINEHPAADTAATKVRAFMASFGVDSEVLPAGDRVVIHLPIHEVSNLMAAARLRGMEIRTEIPGQLSLWDEPEQLALAY